MADGSDPLGRADSNPLSGALPTDEGGVLAQGDIEKLIEAAGVGKAVPSPPIPAAKPQPPSGDDGLASGDIEYLLSQAEQALASINSPTDSPTTSSAEPFKLQDFTGAPPSTEAATLELIRDVELDLKIELGRTEMYLEDVLKLRKGSVVPLDKLAGDPVDIYVNGRLIARGEVLVLNDNFCVRVAELIASENAA
jgi:flagellar motor switch protein FliN/FliY